MSTAVATAHPNIAFIKYWGNQDHKLRIPSNGSISMNLDGLISHTRVTFDNQISKDMLSINGKVQNGIALNRVSTVLDKVRQLSGLGCGARVESKNNFPAGTGIASSASAFAALSLAASCAAGLDLSEAHLSRIARLGSGSACRSVPSGFVEWRAGHDDLTSFAYTIAPKDHWDLADCIAVISKTHKRTGSEEGHSIADSSQFQAVRVASAPERLELCRNAIEEKDFDTYAEVTDLDSNMMHAVTLTSLPPLIYWYPETVQVILEVKKMRQKGIPVCYTIDAGPNVHVICTSRYLPQVCSQLRDIPGVDDVITAHPGGPATCTK